MTICRLLVVVLAAVVMVPCRGSLSPSVYLQIFFELDAKIFIS